MYRMMITLSIVLLSIGGSFVHANDSARKDFSVSGSNYSINIALKRGAAGETTTINYQRTDRNIHAIAQIYGFKLADPNDDAKVYRGPTNGMVGVADYFKNFSMQECFQGKVVLDVASGGGALVHSLRRYGVDAYGIDLVPPSQDNQCEVEKPLILPHYAQFEKFALFEGSATNMPYEDQSIDRILSTWGPLSYWNGKMSADAKIAQMRIVRESIREMVRVLKDGGMALIGPIAELYYGTKLPVTVFDIAQEEIKDMPAMRVYRGMGRSSSGCSYCVYMVMTKGDVDPENFCTKARAE